MLPYDDYYELLGVSPTASAAEITQAFRSLAKAYHPDRNIAHPDRVQAESFSYITAAYETLKDPEKRRAYDQQLRTQLAIATSPARRSRAFWGGAGAGVAIAAIFVGLFVFPSSMPWKIHEGKYQDSLSSRNPAQAIPSPIVIEVTEKSSKLTSQLNRDLDRNEGTIDFAARPAPRSSEEETKPVSGDEPVAPGNGPAPVEAGLTPAAEQRKAAEATRKLTPREEKDQPKIIDVAQTPSNEPYPPSSLTNKTPLSASARKPGASRFAEEVAGLEAQIARGADGSAAYRLISIVTTATREDDLKQASTVAKNEQTIELINRRLKQIADQRNRTEMAQPAPRPPLFEREPAVDCTGCPPMMLIPAGNFVMGSPLREQGRAEESPSRRVAIAKPFLFSKSKISIGNWRVCVREGGCRPIRILLFMARPELPATRISWSDAQDYIRWLRNKTGKSYRLPSEAEWEYVSGHMARQRGHETGIASGRGRDAVGEGRFAEIFRVRRAHLFDKPATVAGEPDDLWTGAVEWTADCWHANYAGAPMDGSAWLGDRNGVCGQRVVRGGAVGAFARPETKTARASQAADGRDPFVGFRVVRDVDAAPAVIEAENK